MANSEMKINITDYIDLILNDYIVFSGANFKKYGDLERATLLFNKKYDAARRKLKDDAMQTQADALNVAIQQNGKIIAEHLDFYEEITGGRVILEKTLQQIAAGINEGIQLYYNKFSGGKSPYELLAKAKEYNSLLMTKGKTKKAQTEAVRDFFDLLIKGVQLAGGFDENFLKELRDLGATFSGNKNFHLKQNTLKPVTAISESQSELLRKVIDALKRAKDKFKEANFYTSSKKKQISTNKNELDAHSFASTINYIFSTLIGENLSQNIVYQGVLLALDETDKAFANTILKQMTRQTASGNGKLSWSGEKGMLVGSSKNEKNRVSKVDVISGPFFLTLLQNGKEYRIEIGTNISAKWYKKVTNASQIHIVSETPLGNYFQSKSESRYLAYNTIAHRWANSTDRTETGGFHEAYRVLRAATAATYFNDWFTGSGLALKQGGVDRAQLLMVNGKVYPVITVIRHICEELMMKSSFTQSKNMPFDLHVSNVDHVAGNWIGKGRNIDLAVERSRLANEVMNKLTIAVSLKGSILKKYIY